LIVQSDRASPILNSFRQISLERKIENRNGARVSSIPRRRSRPQLTIALELAENLNNYLNI